MSSRTSVSSYEDSIFEAKEYQQTQMNNHKTSRSSPPASRFRIVTHEDFALKCASEKQQTKQHKETRDNNKKQRHPIIDKVARAWKQHHESVNAAYDAYYGHGFRR